MVLKKIAVCLRQKSRFRASDKEIDSIRSLMYGQEYTDYHKIQPYTVFWKASTLQNVFFPTSSHPKHWELCCRAGLRALCCVSLGKLFPTPYVCTHSSAGASTTDGFNVGTEGGLFLFRRNATTAFPRNHMIPSRLSLQRVPGFILRSWKYSLACHPGELTHLEYLDLLEYFDLF